MKRAIAVLIAHVDHDTLQDMICGTKPLTQENFEILSVSDIEPAQEDGTTSIASAVEALLTMIDFLMENEAEDPHDLQSAQLHVVDFAQRLMDTRKSYARH